MLHEHQQAWGHDSFLRELVPLLGHPLTEEPFPNMASELSLAALSHFLTFYYQKPERRDQHFPLSHTSGESIDTTPQSPLL